MEQLSENNQHQAVYSTSDTMETGVGMATRILAAWILDTRLLVVLLGDVLRARQLATFKYTTSIYLMGDGDCFPHPLGLKLCGRLQS